MSRVPSDRGQVEPGEVGHRRVEVGPAPIDLRQRTKVGGEGAEASEQLFNELILIVDAQQWVGGALLADRGRARRTRRRGAERSGAVCRVHRQIVGQGEDLGAQRPEQPAGQRLAVLVAEEVGATDRSDHQCPTGKQRDGLAAVEK